MPETLTIDEIAARVIRCVARTQHLEPALVTPDASFRELDIDSLAGINIAFAIESEFDIAIPDEAVSQVRTVRDLIRGVETLVAARAQ